MRLRTLVSVTLLLLALFTVPTAAAHPPAVGAVYAATNAMSGNRVMVFDRAPNGSITSSGSFATGGTGTGTGLGNQSGVVLTSDSRHLLVVNAGSDEISLFRVRRNGLSLLDVIGSGGRRPVSVSIHRNLVYVLNAGGAVGAEDNISGFRITKRGRLVPLADSTRPLSAPSTAPAQVSFTPDGDLLVVTEKATNLILTFVVDHYGLPDAPRLNGSVGTTPFGFAFDRRGHLLVSEAFGGAPDASTLSSYEVDDDGMLDVISASVPTTESAACWVQAMLDGRHAYVTNTGSGTISGYSVAPDGSLELLDADGVTGSSGGPGTGPIDMALSEDGRFLYDLRSGPGAIGVFRVRGDGSLMPRGSLLGLPAGANGLAAH